MKNNSLDIARMSFSKSDVLAQVQIIQEIMQSIMKEGTHYGKISGQNSLWKPGAEKLMLTFRISNKLIIEDLSNQDERRYRVRCIAEHINTGSFLGEGVGECSSNEEKFKWREQICSKEFEETPDNKKRILWKKGTWKNGRLSDPYKVYQIMVPCEDTGNSVLKRAKKRALVDMILTVTAASDVFVQDLEDLPETLLPDDKEKQKTSVSDGPKEKIQDTQSTEKMECSECGIPIEEQVYSYSKKFHGKPFCRTHQPKKAK